MTSNRQLPSQLFKAAVGPYISPEIGTVHSGLMGPLNLDLWVAFYLQGNATRKGLATHLLPQGYPGAGCRKAT